MKRMLLIAMACACTFGARATAQVCRVVDPVYESLPERPQAEDPWKAPYPEPEPNAEVARLLAEAKAAAERGDESLAARKLQEATRAMDRWSKQEIRRLHKSGMSAAARGGQRAPKEISDILSIGKSAATLGIETSAIPLATEVLVAYSKARERQLRETGMRIAQQAQPHPPDEFREALFLDQQLQTLSPGATPTGMLDLARELYTAWGNARLTKLEEEADGIDALAEPIPRQGGEALKIAREIRTLGGPTEASLSERAERTMREILEAWLTRRSDVLRASGEAEASQANDLPPDALAKLLGLDREMQKIEVDRSKVQDAASRVIAAWIDAHMLKLSPPGHAAASAGGPRTPEQVAQLVSLSQRLDCLPDALAAAAEPLRNEARAIGEKHLAVFRDKLDCPANPDDLKTLGEIVSGLQSYGWGPYDSRGPACGWRGTIVSRTEQTMSRDTISRPSGQPVHMQWSGQEVTEIRWDVDGDVARVTITGGGKRVVHNRTLVPACGAQDNREETTISILSTPATVPVRIRNLRGEEYLIETEAPAYSERRDTHTTRADSQACPLKGGESDETMTIDVRGYPVLLPDTAILIESLTGGRPSRRLEGEMVVSTPMNHGKLTTVIKWELVRER